jgi:hypothetical protein
LLLNKRVSWFCGIELILCLCNDPNEEFGLIAPVLIKIPAISKAKGLVISDWKFSISEAMANLILALNLKLDVDVAQNLVNGIASATENFQSEITSR